MELQKFLETLLAVSIAVERSIEILKQSLGTMFLLKWLFNPNPDSAKESWRCVAIHLLSAVIAGLTARYSQLSIPNFKNQDLGYVLIGLLGAGGSAFWNHALDLVKAAKVQKEQNAKIAVATTRSLTAATDVNL